LFVCIHADAVNLKTGRRQIGQHRETRYHVKYKGKGRKKKKISTPYTVTVPTYEYFKIGSQRKGTSIWLFAAHKTSAKLSAVLNNEDIQIESVLTVFTIPLILIRRKEGSKQKFMPIATRKKALNWAIW